MEGLIFGILRYLSRKQHAFEEKCKQSIAFSLPGQSVEATGDYPRKKKNQKKPSQISLSS